MNRRPLRISEVEPNNKIVLSKFDFSCDDVDDTIPKPLPQTLNFFMLISGKPASGKTSLILNLIAKNNKCYNKKFDKIFYCTRDPFEYALSWSIRNNTNVLNVYSIKERVSVHGEDIKQTLDLEYFNRKLEQYSNYEYWAEDNFNITRAVNYNDSHRDIDSMMKELTGLDHNVEDRLGISLQEYSTIRYMTSMYMQTKDKKVIMTEVDILFFNSLFI